MSTYHDLFDRWTKHLFSEFGIGISKPTIITSDILLLKHLNEVLESPKLKTLEELNSTSAITKLSPKFKIYLFSVLFCVYRRIP